MYATANKKMLNMLILDILKEYSDEEHHLTQQEIIRILKSRYGMECDRRSVKNNIEYLNDLGIEISMEDGYWLMHRDFENAELQLLIDSVLYSKMLSKKQTKVLIDKICSMGNKYFRNTMSRVSSVSDMSYLNNKQMLYTLDTVNEAIAKGKKISGVYHSYKVEDGRLQKKRYKEAIWSPYQIVLNNGNYYLVGNLDNGNSITTTRMDKLENVKILDEKAKPREQFKEFENGISNSDYIRGNKRMLGGPQRYVKLLTGEWMLNEIIDWVGTDIQVHKTDVEGKIEVSFRANDMALFFWALQYGPFIEIIEPATMREELADAAIEIYKKYSDADTKL